MEGRKDVEWSFFFFVKKYMFLHVPGEYFCVCEKLISTTDDVRHMRFILVFFFKYFFFCNYCLLLRMYGMEVGCEGIHWHQREREYFQIFTI